MSLNLKEVVKQSLDARNVGPQILTNVDVYIYRSVQRLMKKGLLPPRTWEFTSLDEKQEKNYKGEFTYNFYYLPEDFGTLEEFYVVGADAYFWTSNENEIFQDKLDEEGDDAERLFTIKDITFDTEAGYDKQLIANPFPDDDKTIRLKYFINGKGDSWKFIDENYWEAVIAEVESILGLASPQQAEEQTSEAIGSWREQSGRGKYNETQKRLSGTYFGGKRTSNLRVKNLEDKDDN